MTVSTVLFSPHRLETPYGDTTVFLAGSIDMGHAQEWQKEVCETLTDCLVLNPRRLDWDSSWKQEMSNPKFKEQVDWELDHLEMADIAFFYFDPAGKAPITLMELGIRAAKSGTMVVVCPEGYWRRGNVEILCHRYGVPVLKDLKTGISIVQQMVDKIRKEIYPTQVEQLVKFVKSEHQTALRPVMVTVEGPTLGGFWFIEIFDLANDRNHIVVEWNIQTHFGLSDITKNVGMEGYGERPSEHFESIEAVKLRIDELLK